MYFGVKYDLSIFLTGLLRVAHKWQLPDPYSAASGLRRSELELMGTRVCVFCQS